MDPQWRPPRDRVSKRWITGDCPLHQQWVLGEARGQALRIRLAFQYTQDDPTITPPLARTMRSEQADHNPTHGASPMELNDSRFPSGRLNIPNREPEYCGRIPRPPRYSGAVATRPPLISYMAASRSRCLQRSHWSLLLIPCKSPNLLGLYRPTLCRYQRFDTLKPDLSGCWRDLVSRIVSIVGFLLYSSGKLA